VGKRVFTFAVSIFTPLVPHIAILQKGHYTWFLNLFEAISFFVMLSKVEAQKRFSEKKDYSELRITAPAFQIILKQNIR